ncbi:hypothetical protein EDD18DRAFT_1359918 [Armillaria luteobubalina]|uniref:Uncharacterized protein n=1 Tax=Armillaria luteobubalina TaxID=153913 RepID=A0AA39UQA3_9AGAR|nr:hypothetical protein EDD18DRAFT_1359918 [Armillaria luteobubalina]
MAPPKKCNGQNTNADTEATPLPTHRSHRNQVQPNPTPLVPAAEVAATTDHIATADTHQVAQPQIPPCQILQPPVPPPQASPTPGVQAMFHVCGYNHYRPVPNTQGVFPTPSEMQTLRQLLPAQFNVLNLRKI